MRLPDVGRAARQGPAARSDPAGQPQSRPASRRSRSTTSTGCARRCATCGRCATGGSATSGDPSPAVRTRTGWPVPTAPPRTTGWSWSSSATSSRPSAAVPRPRTRSCSPDVSAVLTYNDMIAIGLMHRLVGYGVRIPDEISVVGFDDIPLAEMTYPPLTTVRFPRREAGEAAVDRLMRVLDGAEPQEDAAPLPTELVVRGSTTRLETPSEGNRVCTNPRGPRPGRPAPPRPSSRRRRRRRHRTGTPDERHVRRRHRRRRRHPRAGTRSPCATCRPAPWCTSTATSSG